MAKSCSTCGNSGHLCLSDPEVNNNPEYFICAMCSNDLQTCNICPFLERCLKNNPEATEDTSTDIDDPEEMYDLCMVLDFLREARLKVDILKFNDYKGWIKSSIDKIGEYLNKDLTSGDNNAGETKIRNTQ